MGLAPNEGDDLAGQSAIFGRPIEGEDISLTGDVHGSSQAPNEGESWTNYLTPPGLNNSAEGGSHDTDLTTGNSGGASGNAFDFVNDEDIQFLWPTDKTIFSSDQAYEGSLSMNLLKDPIDPNYPFGDGNFGWSTSFGSPTEFWGRAYLYLDDVTDTWNNFNIIFMTTPSEWSWVEEARISIQQDRSISIDSTGSAVTTSSELAPMNAWFRLEWHVQANSSGTDSIELRVFIDPAGTTPDDTIAITDGDFGSFTHYAFVGFDHGSGGGNTFIDNVNLNTSRYIGP